MFESLSLPIFASSSVSHNDTAYALALADHDERLLVINGNAEGFAGQQIDTTLLLAPLTSENARALRARLPWLRPVTLGLSTSAGFGDRLGLATPGHVRAVRDTGVAPIFAQQSVRENARTRRTPQQVVDDAMWGVFQEGWREPWGADADHLKTVDDIPPFVAAGYTFFTIDPGEYVDDDAEYADPLTLLARAEALPWQDLQSSLADTRSRYLQTFHLDQLTLTFDEQTLTKAVAKYGGAVAHAARMARRMQELMAPGTFEIEVSVDETGTTTTWLEHFYIASELRRLQVPFVSLAPRFVGRFEKGVGYIGDLQELELDIAGHASIMRSFGQSYKLSLHTGSDKFEVYPPSMRLTAGLVHLKTAGTSYLEALHLLASLDPPLFRSIWDFARTHYETDRRTYHVSATLETIGPSATLNDQQLVDLFARFDARQILHVTFGSVLDTFGTELQLLLRTHLEAYSTYIQRHFERHLEAFRQNATPA